MMFWLRETHAALQSNSASGKQCCYSSNEQFVLLCDLSWGTRRSDGVLSRLLIVPWPKYDLIITIT